MKKDIHLLIAEDNLLNQKVLRIILERAGFIYDIAEDGFEALSKYQEKPYDLILMDCQMPNLDGLQTSSKIRGMESETKKTRCPIIAMTANAMKGDRERCILAGMDDFLAKPFKSQELLQIIEQWRPK